MNIQEFERLLHQFAREEHTSSPAQIEVNWQRLADRLDTLRAQFPATGHCQPFGDQTFSKDRFTVN